MNSVQIIDNFFEDPDKIVKWANTLSYKKDIKKRWPGKRCCVCEIALHNEDNNFVKKFIEKILSIKYPNNKVNCEGIEIYFQKIEPIPGVGVIHKDDMALAGLIYLTKDANLNSGTFFLSLFINKYGRGLIFFSKLSSFKLLLSLREISLFFTRSIILGTKTKPKTTINIIIRIFLLFIITI